MLHTLEAEKKRNIDQNRNQFLVFFISFFVVFFLSVLKRCPLLRELQRIGSKTGIVIQHATCSTAHKYSNDAQIGSHELRLSVDLREVAHYGARER